MTLLNKRLIAVLHDALMSGLALALAIAARYGFNNLPPTEKYMGWVGLFVIISLIVFKLSGLGRGLWRFASLADLRAIVIAATATISVFVICLFLISRLDGLPRSVPFITWFMMIVMIGAPRLAYRALRDGSLKRVANIQKPDTDIQHVLLAGRVGDAEHVIRTYQLETTGRYKVHGLICTDKKRGGHSIRGIPILGDVADLKNLVERLQRTDIAPDAILSVSSRPPSDFTKILTSAAADLGIPIKRATPRPLDLSEPDFSELTIDDLLGRPPVKLDRSKMNNLISGRVIIITGAGGSIGSEVVRQVLKYAPSRLVLIENSEFALYNIDQELGLTAPTLSKRPVLADVRDRDRIMEIVSTEKPSIIFHAAALKHVPLMEENPLEAIQTNVLGTRNVADAAAAHSVDGFVLISTDKAVKPTSIMGATKRAAEAYCQALDVSGTHTRFITVRFGNVLGSNGSVIPLFRKQIEAGGPVTITHKDMRRYFMTIPEASELVLQAAAFSVDNSNQRGRIYVLDMGDPVKIVDLAKILISLAGLRPEKDIKIKFTGLRPGEKLFEELFEADEDNQPSGADGVIVATANLLPLDKMSQKIEDLGKSVKLGSNDLCILKLGEIVPSLHKDSMDLKAAPFK
ncbi:putative epimerase/dehydratase WbiI [Roseibium sp. TrichSKD4]|uniref:polysaccharide biosynthesis protein n=1 Tax=Roseibium sp. TrichSKD4 TaxID=744980 RepID=UPI0001E565DF|nr:nucleoside-diphosphate sugar epimerase/dehydratase [Roseibium sp. TrichSKD4]EFO34014.1 putative epimerase/dehydratase WbiI [Roseibium sp. TrichSKD4]